MSKHCYNPLTGHYHPINEADEQKSNQSTDKSTQSSNSLVNNADKSVNTNAAQQSTQKDNNTQQNTDPNSTAGKLEGNDEYQKLVALKNEYQRQSEQKLQPLRLQRQKLASELGKKGIDPQLSGKIIQIDDVITKTEQDTQQKINVIDKQVLLLRQKLKVCENLSVMGVPEKYHDMLLETSLEPHKVYLNDLFDDFDTFYCVFENTNLIYGNDHENVFVLIHDYNDVNEARETLYNTGFYEVYVDMCIDPILEKQEPEWFF